MQMDRTSENGRFRRVVTRLLALLALAAVIVAIIVVVGGSVDSSDDGGGKRDDRRAQPREDPKPDQDAKTYVVQPGDNLSAIAEKTGVSVERLEELNPDIDPQALPSGATLKLR